MEAIIYNTTAEHPLQIQDGEWFTITQYNGGPGLWGCCDCGLMHRVEFKIEGGVVYIRVHRDEESTKIYRDTNKIKEFFND